MSVTLVIGASLNPERYAFKAVKALHAHGHKVIAYGLRSGEIDRTPIEITWDETWKADTVTLYMNTARQEAYIDRIIALKPKRVIFNPGTENPFFYEKLTHSGIPFIEACTFVLLATGQY